MRRIPNIILVGIVVGILAAPWLTSFDPMQTDASNTLLSPSPEHLLGTDYLGRDVFSRLLYGGQRTLMITSLAALTGLLTGMGIGLIAGSSSALFDAFWMALLNAFLAFPPLVLAFIILTLLGQSDLALILAVGLAQTASTALVIRAAVQTIRSQDYVLAAQAQGAAPWRIIYAHILPGIQPTVLVYGVMVFGYCLFNSAALSLLGLGSAPGLPDWGVMLAEGRNSFRAAPWVAFAPGSLITTVILCLNVLVDNHNQH
jgi:peptide/nickel transport system permease protein